MIPASFPMCAAALQQKEVIDYGHGRSSEPRDDISTTTDRESNVRARPPDDSRGLARGEDELKTKN